MRSIVVKIGGSTLDSQDTTIEDLVQLQKEGVPLVVVHGGGQLISDWLARLGISTGFVNGLRVTDAASLKVVIAVLGGLVNKELVLAIQAQGGKAIGISGSDGNLLQAKVRNLDLGYVGDIIAVDPTPVKLLLKAGYIPLVAPISRGSVGEKATLLNVNGDAAAGEIAKALTARKLIFLTDVDGIYDRSGKRLPKLSIAEAKGILASGIASGGMIPKIEACLKALATVPLARIIDGTKPHALLKEMANGEGGTSIVAR